MQLACVACSLHASLPLLNAPNRTPLTCCAGCKHGRCTGTAGFCSRHMAQNQPVCVALHAALAASLHAPSPQAVSRGSRACKPAAGRGLQSQIRVHNQATHLLPGFPMEVTQQQKLQVEPEHCVVLDCAKPDPEQLILQDVSATPAPAATSTSSNGVA